MAKKESAEKAVLNLQHAADGLLHAPLTQLSLIGRRLREVLGLPSVLFNFADGLVQPLNRRKPTLDLVRETQAVHRSRDWLEYRSLSTSRSPFQSTYST